MFSGTLMYANIKNCQQHVVNTLLVYDQTVTNFNITQKRIYHGLWFRIYFNSVLNIPQLTHEARIVYSVKHVILVCYVLIEIVFQISTLTCPVYCFKDILPKLMFEFIQPTSEVKAYIFNIQHERNFIFGISVYR